MEKVRISIIFITNDQHCYSKLAYHSLVGMIHGAYSFYVYVTNVLSL